MRPSSGDQPCQQCRTASRECIYPAEEPLKGASLKEELERLRKKCDHLEKCLQTVLPDNAARDDLLRSVESGDTPPAASVYSESSAVDDGETTEGRMLFDPDGNMRFLGETSGATFLDLLKAFMLTLVPLALAPEPGLTVPEDGSTFVASLGRYQTFDSRPLLDLDVDPFWLPTRTEMIMMLAELRYHIQDGNGDFPSGGIYYWGDLSSMPEAITLTVTQSEAAISDRYRYLAFNHVSFALAAQILNQSLHQGEIHAGDAYFKRARILLGNPLDTVRFSLRDVPVLALMALYLIEINRRDAAYVYTSLAMHIAVTHGAARHCADEASKRVFWTVYVLDRWLSCLMGRPPTLADEAIRLPLPIDAPNMPSSAGLRAHVQLARISGFIVCETYKIAPKKLDTNPAAPDVDKPMELLQDWLTHLPASLQMSSAQPSADPACCILHMAHNQLILITIRPILLTAVKRAVAERYMNACSWKLEQQPQFNRIDACSKAAQRNIHLAQWVMQLYNTRRLLQAGLHFVFNAAVILLLNRVLRNQSAAAKEIDFAIDVFTQQSRIGTNYERDCLQVLKDLKILLDRFLSGSCATQQNYSANPARVSQGFINDTQFDVAQGRQILPSNGGNVYQELITWIQDDNTQLHSSFRI
ncbi:uncharacterized protein N0V89_003884 [Didymosphaeria variabile]|uniref:Xylanolytic transcriptional activator regulatory domain-containing protein n=1 Tax=Didymosphaeria variabile TaxID=1932322 RepID=A0A9W8XR42_9PLEO|nr:uncharacterized protein N0V89_003884 [Didymosphaeria variabile]KAJ4355863.1 hypothetical protein N0V89_003884 [Didymosphaeria variabile]